MEDRMDPAIMSFVELLDEYLEFKAAVKFVGWNKVPPDARERHFHVVFELNRRGAPR